MDKKPVVFVLLFIACLVVVATFYAVGHFFRDIHVGILTYFLYVPSVVLLIIFIVGVTYANKRRDISILSSSIVITLSIVVVYGLFLFSQGAETSLSVMNAVVDKEILQKKIDAGITETPPIGFLIPGPDFAPQSFQETERAYSKTAVGVKYEYIDSTNTKSAIHYTEGPVAPELSKGVPKSKDVVYEFAYKGVPVAIMELQTTSSKAPNSPGHASYFLLRVRGDRMIIITVDNVIKKDFTPKTLENMLYKLQVAE